MAANVEITKELVDVAQRGTPWDVGNKVLYDLCRLYPRHEQVDQIVAKVWLIGRAYAADHRAPKREDRVFWRRLLHRARRTEAQGVADRPMAVTALDDARGDPGESRCDSVVSPKAH